jgi:hypothetical protein
MVSCNIRLAFQAGRVLELRGCIGPIRAGNAASQLTKRGDFRECLSKVSDSGPFIGRIIGDNYRIVNRFTAVKPSNPLPSGSRISRKTRSKDMGLQGLRNKKRGECKQRGNCIIALAGGGNQSSLTDGDLQARGNGLHRTLQRKHLLFPHLFPIQAQINFLSLLSPIQLYDNTLRTINLFENRAFEDF